VLTTLKAALVRAAADHPGLLPIVSRHVV
jgi:hypothetical protein